MQKQYRLRKKGQFRYAYRKGRFAGNGKLTLHYIGTGKKAAGFVVSKKIGNAVTRNHTKRLMREIFRLNAGQFKNGIYVFTAKPDIAASDYNAVKQSMLALIRKMSLLKDDPEQ